jgi:CheY-like chemotaxis protein
MGEQPAFLYVEDNPAGHYVMRLLLVNVLGYSDVTLLDDTEDFIETLEMYDKTFDIILLDLNMKPLDGYAACCLLREHDRFRQASIVAITATVSPDDRTRTQAAGFDGIIYKPINPNQFSQHIQCLLDGKTLWQLQ